MFSKKCVDYRINKYIGYRKQDDFRILPAAQKCSYHYKRHCHQLPQQGKRKGPDTTFYQSGTFVNKKQPDMLVMKLILKRKSLDQYLMNQNSNY